MKRNLLPNIRPFHAEQIEAKRDGYRDTWNEVGKNRHVEVPLFKREIQFDKPLDILYEAYVEFGEG